MMYRAGLGLLLVAGVLQSCARWATPIPPSWEEVVNQVSDSVVSITAWSLSEYSTDEQTGVRVQVGSGVVYRSDGLILTNHHVVRGASQIRVELPQGKGHYRADVLGGDERSDLAVLRLRSKGDSQQPPFQLKELQWARTEEMRVGEPVLAIGNPYGFSHTVTSGIVSAVDRVAPVGVFTQGASGDEAGSVLRTLQTDAAIHPGSSGGPLLNRRGEVLGLTTLYFSRTGEPSGIAFAIPTDSLRTIADGLISNGWIRRSWLGIAAQEVDPALGQALGGWGGGALINEVVLGSPADGILQSGDLIVEWDGHPIRRLLDFRDQVQFFVPGSEVELSLIRDGTWIQRWVRPTEWRGKGIEGGALLEKKSPRKEVRLVRQKQKGMVEFLGMHLGQITERRPFDLPASPLVRGVRIESIDPQSPAWMAGLFPGDWILEVNGHAISGIEALPHLAQVQDVRDILLTIRQGGGLGPRAYRWISRSWVDLPQKTNRVTHLDSSLTQR